MYTKLSSNFQIKDKTNVDHKHDLVYYIKCPEWTTQEKYAGDLINGFLTIVERIANLTCQNIPWKITITLLIKELRPSLNTQESSAPLLL